MDSHDQLVGWDPNGGGGGVVKLILRSPHASLKEKK